MTTDRKGWNKALAACLMGVFALSAAAILISRVRATEHVAIAGHTFVLPEDADVTQTMLPDGRMFDVDGVKGVAYLVDGFHRELVRLPEPRRFASTTVMPTGQVLLWGGVDAQGRVLDTGEWFEPTNAKFVRTGQLGLSARAGHSLTVLTSGQLLLTGGVLANGQLATTAVLWDPQSFKSIELTAPRDLARVMPNASLESDGSVRIGGGLDEQGQAVASVKRFVPATQAFANVLNTENENASQAAIVESLPNANAQSAPLRGKLTLRFATPADVRALNTQNITLLGPEGIVPLHVFGAEAGRLAFIQPKDDLYPGSRYTLFVKGVRTTDGRDIPYATIGFDTASVMATGVALGGRGSARNANSETPKSPLYVMAGGGHAYCDGQKPDQLCRKQSYIRDGAWFPGDNNVADATGGHLAPLSRTPILARHACAGG